MKLDRLEDDVSRLHADFDGLKSPQDHTPQINLLEVDVSRIDAAVEELRTQIRTATSASATSTATRDNACLQCTTPPESDDKAALHSETATMGDNACTQLKHPPEFGNTATLPSENTQGLLECQLLATPCSQTRIRIIRNLAGLPPPKGCPRKTIHAWMRTGPRSERMAARTLVVHLSAMAIPIMSVIFLLMTISDCKRRMMIL